MKILEKYVRICVTIDQGVMAVINEGTTEIQC